MRKERTLYPRGLVATDGKRGRYRGGSQTVPTHLPGAIIDLRDAQFRSGVTSRINPETLFPRTAAATLR